MFCGERMWMMGGGGGFIQTVLCYICALGKMGSVRVLCMHNYQNDVGLCRLWEYAKQINVR